MIIIILCFHGWKDAKVFGFNKNEYGLREFMVLLERFQSFWFQKYTKPLIWPIVFHDITHSKIFKNEM